jgi:hypothetical protein
MQVTCEATRGRTELLLDVQQLTQWRWYVSMTTNPMESRSADAGHVEVVRDQSSATVLIHANDSYVVHRDIREKQSFEVHGHFTRSCLGRKKSQQTETVAKWASNKKGRANPALELYK